MEKPEFKLSLIHPRYWFTWLGFALWWTVSQLPYPALMALGKLLGRFLYRTAKSRVSIARRNIQLCFPEKSTEEQETMVKATIESTAIALFESGVTWFWPVERLRHLATIEGLEHLRQLNGQGAVLVAMHFTTLDIGGALLAQAYTIDAMYRPHRNPVYDFFQRWGRGRHSPETQILDRNDVRGMVRALRRGRVIWYAPDQDYGRKHSVFVPFFGVPAATITTTSRFARLGQAKVIPFVQYRLPEAKGYRLRVFPPLESYPSGDELADTALINRYIEQRIREQPEQYMWVHRRFKTRPEGESAVYSEAP